MTHSVGKRVAEVVVGAFFGSWFLATFLSQDPRRKFEKIRQQDRTGAIIPDWRFFAPRPGMHDNHVLTRDELPDASMTEWREVTSPRDRKLLDAVWFVGRRGEKAITDAASGLMMFTANNTEKKEAIQVTIPYLTLLNYITHGIDHHPDAKRTQFLIATSDGYAEQEEPTMMFLSNLHPID
ncbi:hypothetical protein [Amycolatopsis sp. H20-H5]|uniref:hypothetical protein n=1 Tax=Amycolatopsis sp. H20-H5 TaxID=3046309 RepID=UPI002DBEC601|nr:hypothetical protein [Amycolatopsis sp. H20-H5]MEC3975493.1 hypothetical protein [Amycolatopsis sp. H20-H5]